MTVRRKGQCRMQGPGRKVDGHLPLKAAAGREYKRSKDTACQPIHHRKRLSDFPPQRVFASTSYCSIT